jgi:OmpA-OmpF porin, OOP family
MKLRSLLAAVTCLALPVAALPVAAHASTPITGPYVDAGIGTSILLSPNYHFPAFSGTGGKLQYRNSYAGVFDAGWGFGNGLRIQLGGNFYRNTIHAAAPNVGNKTILSGGNNRYGIMVNAIYDIPVDFPVTPYFGAGVGYQWERLQRLTSSAGETINGTGGSFAYDVIVGAAYDLPQVPGLALTAEYRFMQLTQTRGYNYSLGHFGTRIDVGQSSSHTFLLGVRYALWQPPPPPPPAPPPPVAAPAPAPAKTYLVFFDWDKYNLTPRATEIIAQAASDSKTQNTTTIDVSGFTDTTGTPEYNLGLSERRAKAVAAQLVSDGVPESIIEIHAYGDTHLLVPTGPGVREPQNRRVEIVLQ